MKATPVILARTEETEAWLTAPTAASSFGRVGVKMTWLVNAKSGSTVKGDEPNQA